MFKNFDEHIGHLNILSCLWTRRWTDALDELVNVIGHSPHLNGRSPVCVATWHLSPPLWRNFRLQISQLCRYMSAWISRWLASDFFAAKHLPQTLQEVLTGSGLCTFRMCLASMSDVRNFNGHILHENRLQLRK